MCNVSFVQIIARSLDIAMDKQVVKAINQLANCNDIMSDIVMAATAAEKAANSAITFYNADYVDLSNARIKRTEDLLNSLRQTLRSMERKIRSVHNDILKVLDLPVVMKAAWNALPDQWWRSRATTLKALLDEFERSQRGVMTTLNVVVDGTAGYGNSYADLVSNIRSAVDGMSNKWRSVIGYVDEWKDVAAVMVEGIGESGSLLPS